MVRRYIVIPKILPLYQLDGRTQVRDDRDKPVTVAFERFVEGRTVDPAFVTETPRDPQNPPQWSMPMIVSAEAVRAAFRGKEEGEVAEIDDDDWQRLRRATEKGSYHAIDAASLIPFMRAIVDAKTEDPRKVEPKPADKERAQ